MAKETVLERNRMASQSLHVVLVHTAYLVRFYEEDLRIDCEVRREEAQSFNPFDLSAGDG